jgi:hypothetical protein
MLHAKMVPLLAQVYHSRLGHDATTMGDCGGQKIKITPGGIRDAEISRFIIVYYILTVACIYPNLI